MTAPTTCKRGVGPSIESLLPDHLLERVLDRVCSKGDRQPAHTFGPDDSAGGGGSISAAASSSNSCSSSSDADGSTASLPLVCRRWRRVFNTSQLLHGTLNLNLQQLEAQLQSQDDLAGLLHLLAHRGQAVRRLWLHSEGTVLRMSTVLQFMPTQLQAVYLGQGACPDSLSQLHRFPGLRCLDIPAGAFSSAELGCQLSGFSCLEELTVREGSDTAQGLLSSLAALPHLRLLSLTVVEGLSPAWHHQLAHLQQLQELHIYLQPACSHPTRFEFNPGVLSALTQLRSLLLVAPSCCRCEALALGPGLPCLPALQELQVESQVEAVPADLWSCPHLTRLELDLKGAPLADPQPEAVMSAVAGTARGAGPGPGAGAACLPALRELRLARCSLPGGVLPAVLCDLSTLRRLEVVECGLASGCGPSQGQSQGQGLPPHLSRLTQLEHLCLEGNRLRSLPPCVAALPALRYLDLGCNQLADAAGEDGGAGAGAGPCLPPGPYLSSLETLILSANRLATVPPVLCAASCLEVLDLSGNPGLELSRHDVDATLARMPRLSLLLLGKQAAGGGGLDAGMGVPTPAAGSAPAAGAGQGSGGSMDWRTPSVAALVALGRALPQLQIDFEHTAKEYEGVGM